MEGNAWGLNGVGKTRLKHIEQIQRAVRCSSYTEMKRLFQERLSFSRVNSELSQGSRIT